MRASDPVLRRRNHLGHILCVRQRLLDRIDVRAVTCVGATSSTASSAFS